MLTQTSRFRNNAYQSFDTPSTSMIKRKTRQLSQQQQQQIKQAFVLFDPHQTGKISYHELKVILRALGFDMKKSEVVQIAREYDIQETGRINFEDYYEIMRAKYSERDPIQEIIKAFKLFDEDGKGKISLLDLKKVAKEIGEPIKQQELIAMIEEFDTNGDGMINQEQFLAIIRPSLT